MSDLVVVSLDGPARRLLAAPTHETEQPPDMAGVVADASPALDHRGDPLQRPEVGVEAARPGALEQHRLDGLQLADLQLGWTTGTSRTLEPIDALAEPGIAPGTGRPAAHAQYTSNLSRASALLEHLGRLQAALLEHLVVSWRPARKPRVTSIARTCRRRFQFHPPYCLTDLSLLGEGL